MAPLRCLTDCEVRLDGKEAPGRFERRRPRDTDVKTSKQTVQNSESKIPSRLPSAWGLEGLSQKLKCAAGTKRSLGPTTGPPKPLSSVHSGNHRSRATAHQSPDISPLSTFLVDCLPSSDSRPASPPRACGSFFSRAKGRVDRESVAEVRGHNSPQQPKSCLSRR